MHWSALEHLPLRKKEQDWHSPVECLTLPRDGWLPRIRYGIRESSFALIASSTEEGPSELGESSKERVLNADWPDKLETSDSLREWRRIVDAIVGTQYRILTDIANY